MTWTLIFSCWILAVISTLGSLFFSEVMHFPPCVLCWYQRICMYPLCVILLGGLFPLDKKVIRYVFPLVLIGWLIATYHNLLYAKIISESSAPCIQGISCTSVQIEWFGFVTIPLLSLMSFSLILLLMIFAIRNFNHEK
jgi:disulfide bond formation protein DsbB